MAEPLSFDPPRDESIALLETPGAPRASLAGGALRRFEFSCRGDRVPLATIAPESGAPSATWLVQPLPGGSSDLTRLRGVQDCLAAGVALATIELPLFGARRSPKLSEKLSGAIAAASRGEDIDPTSRILWTEFARQSVIELRRSLDVLEQLFGRPAAGAAFAGVGIAASVGAIACAVDDRLRGAVLVGTGGGFGPEEVDPASHVADIAPRPLLLVTRADAAGAPGAPRMPAARVDALRQAAGQPVEVQERGDDDLLGPAWKFLSPLLQRLVS